MKDFVQEYYLIIKAIHVISIICWMAGLLYLPRLFVYHCKVINNPEQSKIFTLMEKRLLLYITKPAFFISLITGLLIGKYVYDFHGLWIHLKFTIVFLLLLFNIFLLYSYKRFSKNQNNISEKSWRLINEIPTILMVIIVFIVIIKPV